MTSFRLRSGASSFPLGSRVEHEEKGESPRQNPWKSSWSGCVFKIFVKIGRMLLSLVILMKEMKCSQPKIERELIESCVLSNQVFYMLCSKNMVYLLKKNDMLIYSPNQFCHFQNNFYPIQCSYLNIFSNSRNNLKSHFPALLSTLSSTQFVFPCSSPNSVYRVVF